MPTSSDSEGTKESGEERPREREHRVEKPGHQRDGECTWQCECGRVVTARPEGRPGRVTTLSDEKPLEAIN